MSGKKIVLGITGASGSAYAVRLAQVLLLADCEIHLVVSEAARQVALRELGTTLPPDSADSPAWLRFLEAAFRNAPSNSWGMRDVDLPAESRLFVHSFRDYSAGIASGSFLTDGMVLCPCSMGTLSSIANGASTNLVQRAADVHLKERRPLVIVPRESPLGMIALENMTRLAQAGATILPSMPGFYHNPGSIADLVDFIVARVCDQLKIEHTLMKRWGEDE